MANSLKLASISLAIASSIFTPLAYSQDTANAALNARMEAAKNAGAAIAGGINPQGFVLDSTGQPVRNPDGTPKLSGPSTLGGSSQVGIFKDLTGTQGVQITGDAARGPSFGGTFKSTGSVDLTCGDPIGKSLFAQGLTLKFDGCAASAIKLKICDRTKFSAACDKPEYFADYVVPVGSFQTSALPSGASNTIALGAGCNNVTGVCRITFQMSESVTGNSSTMVVQDAGAAIRNSSESAYGATGARIQSQEFLDRLATTGTDLKNCVNKMDRQGANGTVTTCDGSAPINIGGVTKSDGTPLNTACDKDPVCKKSTEIVEKFETSCVRSASLTTKACSSQIPTRTCTESKPGGVDCTEEELVGATLVGDTPFVCVQEVQEPVLDSTGQPVLDSTGAPQVVTKCVKEERTLFYYFPGRAQDTGCSATPFPLRQPEQCAAPTTAERFCPDGAIFGRTLSTAECSVQTSVLEPVFFDEKAGCGVCTRPTLGYSCLAQPQVNEPEDTCKLPADATCSLLSIEPHTGQNGLLDAQKENYQCVRKSTVCTEFDTSQSCQTINTFGLDKKPATKPDFGAFARAMVGMSMVSGAAQSAEKESIRNPEIPKVFTGMDSRCRKPTGFLSGLLFNNCCRTNLERPGGSRPLHKCTLDEVRLAAARRAAKTVYIGEYCSARKKFIGCIERTETYCAFDDMLPRIIHEQGRVQLAKIVSGTFGSSAEVKPLNFNFYEGSGGWTSDLESNGLTIKAWRQPSYCSNSETAIAHLTANPGAQECVGKTEAYFAVCEKAGACGTLPVDPYDRPTDSKWLVIPVDALTNKSTGSTPYLTLTGACNTATGACSYQAETLPAGQAGRAYVTIPTSIELYVAPENTPGTGTTDGTEVASETMLIGETVLRPLSLVGPLSDKLPATLGFFVSTDYGRTYQKLTMPITGGVIDGTLSNGYRVTGNCNPVANVCDLKVSGEVSITAKPFGGPQGPDCSGFTFAQVSALDFSKMDLSEWISKITSQAQSALQSNLGADKFIGDATASYLQAMRSESIVTTAPSRFDTARVYPRQEYGPFRAKLMVVGNFPVVYLDDSKNVDPINRVQVDWGDCTIPTELEAVLPEEPTPGSSRLIPVFVGTHDYASPDAVPSACGGGENNINHTVKVTMYSATGIHTTTLRVINVFKDFPTSIGFDEGEAGKISSEITGRPAPDSSLDLNEFYKP